MTYASNPLSQVTPAWHLFTRLGEAQILLPAMAAMLLWLVAAARAPRMAAWWLGGTAAAALVTTATKVAFFGYEVGYAPLDYTGISGHAMFAAAVLPVLAALLAGGSRPRWRRATVAGGYLLAAAVAYSRLPVLAHSPAEVVAGLVLGSLASGLALWAPPLPQARPPAWLAASSVIWVVSLPAGAPPSPPWLGGAPVAGGLRSGQALPALADAPRLPPRAEAPAGLTGISAGSDRLALSRRRR